jgi:Ser/Thr protein kinase RdoA (MazF antagonist)
VTKTAVGLAALHGSGVEHGELVTWDEEAADVAEVAERLAELAPETAGAVDAYLAALQRVAAEHPADPVGPAHRSFRPAQVLLAGGGIAFIDFDGLCTAEPAIDVALFRAALRDATLRHAPDDAASRRVREQAVGSVCEDFLAAYEATAPISRARVALWEGLYLLTFVLHCWTKVRPARIAGRMDLLMSHLTAMQCDFSSGSGAT